MAKAKSLAIDLMEVVGNDGTAVIQCVDVDGNQWISPAQPGNVDFDAYVAGIGEGAVTAAEVAVVIQEDVPRVEVIPEDPIILVNEAVTEAAAGE